MQRDYSIVRLIKTVSEWAEQACRTGTGILRRRKKKINKFSSYLCESENFKYDLVRKYVAFITHIYLTPNHIP